MRKLHCFFAAIFVLVLAVTITSAHTQNFIALHQFTGGTDGAFPEGALVRDAAGNLYGMTTSGGIGEGTVYKIDSAGSETILCTFQFVNGGVPASPLLQDQAGNLYGIADGGPGGAGIIFKLSPDGEQTLLHAFEGGFNLKPKVPTGGIFQDKFGNIFGTTLFGGNGSCRFGCGTIFRLHPAGTLTRLHKFIGSDGRHPFGPLVQDADGNLYGVAQSGGDLSCPEFPHAGCGTVFKLAKNRELTVLHTFHGGKAGASPQPGLLLDAAGNLYGATGRGGTADNGTVFKISKDGTYRVLHRFTGGDDGKTPNGGLVADEAGNLYGTAQGGGVEGLGTVFELRPGGRLTVLHAFTGDLDGAFPLAGLIRDELGHLYGTAVRNFLIQPVQGGNAFEIRP